LAEEAPTRKSTRKKKEEASKALTGKSSLRQRDCRTKWSLGHRFTTPPPSAVGARKKGTGGSHEEGEGERG